MVNKFISLLPPNALESERALEHATTDLMTSVPLMIREVKDPEKCPVDLLPWLAWEFSVDTWNTDWTEGERRAAIQRAAYIHRHRGTRAALETSLSTSPFSSNIIEWFEKKPKGEPYTFSLHVMQDDRPLTLNDVQDLKTAVMKGKNLRSWFDVSFFGSLSGKAILAGYMKSSETVMMMPTFELIGIYVNGWLTSDFNPQTAFMGAKYSLTFQGGIGGVTWDVSGPATLKVEDQGAVTITVSDFGKIIIIGTDEYERQISHEINPQLFFIQDGTKGTISTAPQWANSYGARLPVISEMTYGVPTNGLYTKRGVMGSLWSEWGDMAFYDWPGSPVGTEVNADLWISTSVVPNRPTYVYMPLLSGKNNVIESYSSNGVVYEVMATNNNKSFRRCCVLDFASPFSIAGFNINGWFTVGFSPISSFAGATYKIVATGRKGPVTWTLTGPGTISAEGLITITGPGGPITVEGTNTFGEKVQHTITPQKYFVHSPSPLAKKDFTAFVTSTGGVRAIYRDMTLSKTRGMGALWNEWGNMAAYGWPAWVGETITPETWRAGSPSSPLVAVYLTDGSSFALGEYVGEKNYIAAYINI